jgi:hypothetical protein
VRLHKDEPPAYKEIRRKRMFKPKFLLIAKLPFCIFGKKEDIRYFLLATNPVNKIPVSGRGKFRNLVVDMAIAVQIYSTPIATARAQFFQKSIKAVHRVSVPGHVRLLFILCRF